MATMHGHDHDHWPRRHLPAALLQLIWLASPALPVGGFSYSEGLEAAVDARPGAATKQTAADWLVEQLHLTPGARPTSPWWRRPLPAWRAADDERVAALNAWVLQTRETAELRQQTEQMGRSLRGVAQVRPAPTQARARAARAR